MIHELIDGYALAVKCSEFADRMSFDESEALWRRAEDEAAQSHERGTQAHEVLTHTIRTRMLNEMVAHHD